MELIEQVLALRGDGLTQAQVGARLKISRFRVCNIERIARKAPPDWLGWVRQQRLTLKHLEAVLTLPPPKAEELLRKAMALGWRAEQLREAVRVAKGGRAVDAAHDNVDVAALERTLSELLATRVQIISERLGGELRIRYSDNDTLEGVLERLGWRPE